MSDEAKKRIGCVTVEIKKEENSVKKFSVENFSFNNYKYVITVLVPTKNSDQIHGSGSDQIHGSGSEQIHGSGTLSDFLLRLTVTGSYCVAVCNPQYITVIKSLMHFCR